MNANQSKQKQGLKWRCRVHPTLSSDFICLDGNSKDRVVCFKCVQKQSIPFSNLVSISSILAANMHDIIEVYPPLKDQELSNRLRDANQQLHREEIGVYFKKLREDFEKEVRAAELKAKDFLIKEERVHKELLEGYMSIAEVEKLKQLIVSEKQSAEKDLDSFIKEKWDKAEENRKAMMNLINLQDQQQLSSDRPNRIAQEIIESLQHINFFQSSIQEPVTFLKSTYNTSQKMKITIDANSIYQIKKQRTNQLWDQVFIDPILNHLKKYILQIEIEMKHRNSNLEFFFGLVKDEGKDDSFAFGQHMSYYGHSNDFGITKYIKGRPMQSGTKATGKHSFEVRIDLNQKILRVACLPDYSSVAELQNPNKIDPRVAYRFFLSMYNAGDIMRITNFRTVSEFDEKM